MESLYFQNIGKYLDIYINPLAYTCLEKLFGVLLGSDTSLGTFWEEYIILEFLFGQLPTSVVVELLPSGDTEWFSLLVEPVLIFLPGYFAILACVHILVETLGFTQVMQEEFPVAGLWLANISSLTNHRPATGNFYCITWVNPSVSTICPLLAACVVPNFMWRQLVS